MKNTFIARVSIAVILVSLQAPSLSADEAVGADSFIKLSQKKNLWFEIGFHIPLRNRIPGHFLLSIDGENLTKCSFEQIKKKLAGAPNSQVKIEVGFDNGDTEILEINRGHREGLTNKSFPLTELGNRLNNLRTTYSAANLVENSTHNTDLIAKAKCSKAFAARQESGANVIGTLMNCMLLSVSIGDFDAAEKYASLAIGRMTKDPVDSNTTYREKAVVEDLVLLGKSDEAESVCKYLLLPSASHAPRLPAPITVLESYAAIPTKTAQDASRALAGKICSGEVPRVVTFYEDTFWLAQYVEAQGWNEKAINLYAKEIANLQKPAYPPDYRGMQAIAFGLYSKARLEALTGKRDVAEKDLEAILTNYKKLSDKQQQLIARMPEFFPKVADVENALDSLRKTSSFAPSPRVDGYSNNDNFVLSGSDPAFKRSLQNAQKCFSLIKTNKKGDAELLAGDLVTAYQVSETEPNRYSVRQNLFCTVLRIARGFADRGWFDASNNLLSQLDVAATKKIPKIPPGDIGWYMIAAEHLYNKASQSKDSLPISAWQSLGLDDRSLTKARLSKADILCLLAEAYRLADEPKRAKVFIDQSIAEVSANSADSGYPTDKQAVVYANAACIYAGLSDPRKQEQYLALALQNTKTLSASLAGALLDLSTIFSNSGKTDRAIYVLEQAIKLAPSRELVMYDFKLDRKLAELYAKNGQPGKAIGSIEKTISSKNGTPPSQDYVVAAEAYNASKDYAKAAKNYYEAGRQFNHGLNEEQREVMLRKSIECAEKVADFDKSALAKTYVELSGCVMRKNIQNGLELLQKAVAIMPDNDPEKPKQLSSISYLLGELKQNTSPTKDTANHGLADRTTAVFEDRIASAKQAAELASANKAADAGEYWLRLASLVAGANRTDVAVEDVRKAIALYQIGRHYFSQLLPAHIPLAIATAGAPDKAEALLKEAQARVDAISGANSLSSQVQLFHHFNYLVARKNYQQADSILDALLKTNLNQGGYSPPNHDINICHFGGGPYPVESSLEVVKSLLDLLSHPLGGADSQQQMRYLNMIIDAEIKQFGDADYRVGITYAARARAHFAANQNEEAYKDFASAINIMHQYEDMSYVMRNLDPEFQQVMLKLDKKAELNKIEDIKIHEQRDRPAGFRKWPRKDRESFQVK